MERNQFVFIFAEVCKPVVQFEVREVKLLFAAQKQFTDWADPKKTVNRTVQGLMEKLDSGFFKLLDELTIARSRRHIETFYDMAAIGKV